MRGEKALSATGFECQSGSPPLARGKAQLLDILCHLAGITPACAGKSAEIAADLDGLEDHPRLRGEKAFGHSDAQTYEGSPPLARGKAI